MHRRLGVAVGSTDRRVEPATMVKFPHTSAEGAALSRARCLSMLTVVPLRAAMCSLSLIEYLLYNSVTTTAREDGKSPKRQLPSFREHSRTSLRRLKL